MTNKTWEHFWLNEGWTVWLERKIVSRIEGDDRIFDFRAIGGWESLKESVAQVPENYSRLVPTLGDDDPDEAYSSVPYEKGFCLLHCLEKRVGKERFGHFAKAYLDRFKFVTCTSEEFRAFVNEYFKGEPLIESFDWDTWLYKGGMPIEDPGFDRSLTNSAEDLANAWMTYDANEIDVPDVSISTWSTGLVLCFLDTLLSNLDAKEKSLSVSTIAEMEGMYRMSSSGNSEILLRWCKLCIKSGESVDCSLQ